MIGKREHSAAVTRTVEVAADAYRIYDRSTRMLRHSLRDDNVFTLCGRIVYANTVTDSAITDQKPTCPRCLAKDERFSAGGVKAKGGK